MTITAEQIRGYRLCAHHLENKLPLNRMLEAAGACGLQNTPPGAWQTALFNRLDGCTTDALDNALYSEKTLLQAWSYRGVPVVFPTGQSDVFLTPLIAQKNEQPWIYTLGISGALEYLQMPFDDLLLRTKKAALYLDSHTIKSKEALDQTLADIIQQELPKDKQALWRAPSMYGKPGKQTVGGAAVSFLLRPCSFNSLVVFGKRQGISPTFTSFKNWVGRAPNPIADAKKKLVRNFLHCYGPATAECFMSWLGCSKRQANRLWGSVLDELSPVEVEGKTRYILSADYKDLLSAKTNNEKLILLGPHDPYLDLRDREVVLANKAHQKTLWQYISNPGAVLKGGRVIGVWKASKLKDKLDVSITMWESTTGKEQKHLKQLAEEYAVFRRLCIRECRIEAM